MAGDGHVPVLYRQTLDGLRLRSDGVYLDATFGRGGHARGILERIGPKGRLIALDRDPAAAEVAAGIADPRFRFVPAAFSRLGEVARELGESAFDGLLLDLGVSSPQLDQATRGFSFRADGPLDMRMDTRAGQTAAEWLASASAEQIAEVLKRHGEERFARRIASAIVTRRIGEPLTGTLQLANWIAEAMPRHERDKHPATRSFQAIRIFVNDEQGELERVLPQTLDLLRPGGRLVVISFHSLEDRLVKRFMRDQARGDPLPRGLPVTGAAANMRLRLVGRKQVADSDEIERNPRARSAVLRVAERI